MLTSTGQPQRRCEDRRRVSRPLLLQQTAPARQTWLGDQRSGRRRSANASFWRLRGAVPGARPGGGSQHSEPLGPGLRVADRASVAILRKPHCGSIRIDETYIKIRGQWRYLYQAIDEGHTKRDIVLLNKIEQAFSDALLGPADEQLWSQPPRAKRGRNAAPFRTVPVPPENCRDYPPQVLRWRLVTRSYRLNQRFPNRPCRVRENLIAVPFPHTQKMGTVFNPDSPDGSRRYHPRAWKSWRKHRFLLSPAARFTFSASDLASH